MLRIMNNLKRSFSERCFARLAREASSFRRYFSLNKLGRKICYRGHLTTMDLCLLIPKEEVLNIWDVGANKGTWSVMAHSIFPCAEFVLFEPIKELYCRLQKDFNTTEKKVFNFALSDQNGVFNFYRTTNIDSSSLLEPNSALNDVWGVSTQVIEEAKVFTASEVLINYRLPVPDLLKLDVQGAELKVLKGFQDRLRDVKFIIAEVSFVEQYNGQPSAVDIISYLSLFGFQLWSLGSETPLSQRIVETDMLFVNTIRPQILASCR